MAELFDDISRMVGSRIPRREIIRLTAGALAGSALTALWPTRVRARRQACNDPNGFQVIGQATVPFFGGCGSANDAAALTKARAAAETDSKAKSKQCPAECPVPQRISSHPTTLCSCTNFSCKETVTLTDKYICTCDPQRACNNNDICCPDPQICVGGNTCCASENACGNACCGTGTFCCGRGASLCCGNDKYCCGGLACCNSHDECCGYNTCCKPPKYCCGSICCDTEAQCCAYNVCCTPQQHCCNGVCCANNCAPDGSCPGGTGGNPSPTRPPLITWH
jgi:hypothetical protein